MNAWDKQLGLDLLAAVELRRRRRRGPRGDDHRRRPRVLLRRRPARRLRPDGPRRPARRRDGAARALPPDHHRRSGRCPSRCSRRSTGRRSGSAARSRSPATSWWPRESAYLLLAFVNIGLVPDGGSSVFVPRAPARARAAEMALLGERVPAPQALDWGLVDRVASDDAFDAEVDALAERLATGPTRSYAGAKRQLNALVYAGWTSSSSWRRRCSRRWPRSADFVEGVAPSWRSAPPASPATERSGPASQYTARPDGPSVPRCCAARSRRPLLALLVTAVPASAGLILAEAGGGSPNAEDTRHALHDHPRLARRSSSSASRACCSGACQVPRPQGPRRRADPRQHAARDRLDGRRRGDPRVPHGGHVRDAARDQEPGPRRTSTPTATRSPPTPRSPRPTRAAAERRVDEHQGQRPAVRVAVHVPRRREGLRLHRHVRARSA